MSARRILFWLPIAVLLAVLGFRAATGFHICTTQHLPQCPREFQ